MVEPKLRTRRATREWLANDPPPDSRPPPPPTDTRPTFGTERLERMLVDIANGTPPPPDQTNAERAMWRKLTDEVRAIRAKGGEIDIPYESPGVD